jgi:hypothetical protein
MVRVRRHIRRGRALTTRELFERKEKHKVVFGPKMPWSNIDRKFIDLAIEHVREEREVGIGVRKNGTHVFVEGGDRSVNINVDQEDPRWLYRIHTHPSRLSTGHSPKDVLSLLSSEGEQVSIVANGRGEVWAIRKTPRTNPYPDEWWMYMRIYNEDGFAIYTPGGPGAEMARGLGLDVVLLETFDIPRELD